MRVCQQCVTERPPRIIFVYNDEPCSRCGTVSKVRTAPFTKPTQPWCICHEGFWSRGLLDPACRHDELEERDAYVKGLEQIRDGDYPASAINAETWAAEVLTNSTAVHWEVVEILDDL